jgi:fumarate reductase subunit D
MYGLAQLHSAVADLAQLQMHDLVVATVSAPMWDECHTVTVTLMHALSLATAALRWVLYALMLASG